MGIDLCAQGSRSAGQGDRVGQDTLAGRVEHGVHRTERADPIG
jgi:hypothetical protein